MDSNTECRLAALNEAARHRLASESAGDVVENAQAYYEFLQGHPKLTSDSVQGNVHGGSD